MDLKLNVLYAIDEAGNYTPIGSINGHDLDLELMRQGAKPHVMTMNEFREWADKPTADRETLYLEDRYHPDRLFGTTVIKPDSHFGEYPDCEHAKESYNKTWRLWVCSPMKAEKRWRWVCETIEPEDRDPVPPWN